jgi:hypothetical protein
MENSNQLHAQTTTPPCKSPWYLTVSPDAVVKRNISAIPGIQSLFYRSSAHCVVLDKNVYIQKKDKKISLTFL